MIEGYYCSKCNTFHEKVPLSYGVDKPDQWFVIESDKRERRCEYNDDLCVIDDQFYFIRGCLEIPIIDAGDTFVWSVWVSLSKPNFMRANEVWNEPNRINEPPYFGWICTNISIYPETMNLKSHVHTRTVGLRPLIELEPTDHPLALEQRNGITMARVYEIAEQLAFCYNKAD